MRNKKIIIVSIIIPTYNEAKYLPELFAQVTLLKKEIETHNKFNLEVIVIDDGSTDETGKICKTFDCQYLHQNNKGKGNAVRNGVSKSKGDYIVVLDADMEYAPLDILKFTQELEFQNEVSVIYGSRYRKTHFPYLRLWPGKNQSILNLYFSHFLTILFLLKKKKIITDLLTGLKLYPTAMYKEINPKTNGFETDHEITLALVKRQIEIIEIPISYNARTKADGKKIGVSDALKAIKMIIQ
jgi:glycosyltransferase involved in cell wall biosynthesis